MICLCGVGRGYQGDWVAVAAVAEWTEPCGSVWGNVPYQLVMDLSHINRFIPCKPDFEF